MKTMSVGDLIAELVKMPKDALVTINGNPLIDADSMPGFYDGYDRDFIYPEKPGDVAKVVRNYKDKCRLVAFDLEEALLDFPDMEIQEGLLNEKTMANVVKWREEGRTFQKWLTEHNKEMNEKSGE